ncbi:MAG TPA: hypothetical protein VK306_02280 [Acidimicrobiales bacterium]|nr:hypothetical protein [Acidimicrobiales bacterium]
MRFSRWSSGDRDDWIFDPGHRTPPEPTGEEPEPPGDERAGYYRAGDDGARGDGARDDGAGAETPSRWRRRRWLVVGLVAVSVALAVSPLSPFDSDGADEYARVPLPEVATRPSTDTRPEPPAKTTTTTASTLPPAAPPPPTAAPAPVPQMAPPAAVTAPAPIRDAGYRPVFADSFDGGAPDGSVWAIAPFGNPLPATVSDGHLTIRARTDNGASWGHIASTGPRTEGEPSYPDARAWEQGYFEARIRYTDDPWSWPAFWMYSMAKTEAWPGENCSELTSEWDIMENGVENGDGARPAGSWYFTNLHRNTTDHTSDGYCATPDDERRFSQNITHTNLSDWHTWGAYWADGAFCTFLDDVQLQCTEPFDSTSQPMHLVFTMQYLTQCNGCPPRPAELEMQVDWVRVWQP